MEINARFDCVSELLRVQQQRALTAVAAKVPPMPSLTDRGFGPLIFFFFFLIPFCSLADTSNFRALQQSQGRAGQRCAPRDAAEGERMDILT